MIGSVGDQFVDLKNDLFRAAVSRQRFSALALFPHSLRRGELVRFLGNFCRADEATAMPLDDPVCVKTAKRRPRRGTVFYRCRGFRAGLP